ncbi:hypothetical protein [Tateyamaria sp.]|uniref:hypothetical protein n=1 Tax=Tateyamaria sp. TaxID=1929288 RepID=UPI00329C0C67
MLDHSDNYRVHEQPRISANQLAEYALASPSRRQTIIRNAKYAPKFLVAMYNEARWSVCDFLVDGTRPVAKLHTAEINLKAKAAIAPTKFKENKALLSAEAVASFAKTVADTKQYTKNFSNLMFTRVNAPWEKLPMSGVQVSVQIDLISTNVPKGTCGGVILQTSKAIAQKSWREEHSNYVTSLVWMSADDFLKSHGSVDRAACYSVDLFAGKMVNAPSNYKTRVKNLEAACSEIHALWDNIQPPADL